MPAWVLSDYTIWILSTAIGVVGLYLCLRGLWGDRARGRPTCFKCRYDLSATESLTCPECGHVHRDRRKLFKTRRYFKRFAIGLILLLLSLHCHTGPFVQHRRGTLNEPWAHAIVPTTVWIALLPDLDQSGFGLVTRRLWHSEEEPKPWSPLGAWDEDKKGIGPRQFESLASWQADWMVTSCGRVLDHPDRTADQKMQAMDWVLAVCLTRASAADLARRAMAHEHPGVRQRASRILAETKESDAKTVAILTLGLKDVDEIVRSNSTTALGRIGPAAAPAIDALIELAREDPSQSFDSDAYMQMLLMSSPRRGRSVSYEWYSIKPMAAVLRIGPAAVPRLIAELRNADSNVHGPTLQVLAGLGPDAAAAVDAILPFTFMEGKDLKNHLHLRVKALEALADMKVRGMERLLEIAGDAKSPQQMTAIGALESISHSRMVLAAVNPLREMAEKPEHSAEARSAMRAAADRIEALNRTE